MKNERFKIVKYPRTPHLEGSRLGVGDEDIERVPFSEILGRRIVVEEKIDGANCAVSFDADGTLLLQSRGHYLDGGYKERHYNLLKVWANTNAALLYSALGSRYIMYGEWMYAKHTVFYDLLPDYFMEFDIYDRERGVYLSTEQRIKITDVLGIIHSVPVLKEGIFKSKEEILSLIGDSNYISSSHIERLRSLALRDGLDVEGVVAQTDPTRTMEGLYIKLEEDGIVKGRFKYVRASFIQRALSTATRWQARPIITNLLESTAE